MKNVLLLFPFVVACFAQNAEPGSTEAWSPVPPVVTPGVGASAPSDAIVLFDGSSLDAWTAEKGGAPGWTVDGGVLTVKSGAGNIATKEAFADCQLHLEWRTPAVVTGSGQGRGNSGVFLQGLYEVQVLDSFDNPTYPDGQAGAIYKQSVPQVNASRGPGEWQTYDILFTAPRFNNDGSLKSPAFATVLHNGVLIQDHVTIKGPTANRGEPRYEKHPFKLPLVLQEHGNPVSFRNIWIRELGVQRLFNGKHTHGWYSFLEKLGKDNDPQKNFQVENGLLHIEGRNFGYLATKKSYTNYYLKVVFKWGQHQYAPRATGKRDSGVLYHFAASERDNVWPKSFECQVQEGDCGDYWCVGGTNIDSPNHSAIEWNQKRIYRTADFERPNSEWNTLEIICNGNQSEHYVNGHLVNSGVNASVAAGRILLQSEGAEIYYKSVELIPY